MNSFDSMEHRLQITGVREHEMPSNNLSSIGKKVLQFVPYPFLVLSTGGIIHLCNDEFISLSGYGAEEIQGLNLFDLLKTKPDKIWQEFIDSNDAIKQFSASLITKARGCIAMQWTINRDDTEKVFFCSGRTVFTSLAWIEDSSLTPEATTENHLLLEQAIFEMNMKRHVTTGEVTDRLLTGIERLYPGAACSILKLHPDNSLHAYSAPSLPKEYIEQINGTIAAAGIGSCGTAAVTGKAVIVSNIDEDPVWQTARPVAARFGLKACWSVPIHRSNGRVLGTFAIYYRMPKTPTATMLRHMQRWAHLSGILIENNEMVDDLRLLNERHNLAAKATHDMLWDWDLETNIIFRHQDGLRAIYGHSNNDAIRKVSDWTGRIHPNDRARVLRQIER
ncbi:MAG: GAF domain-containing protein, partial [Chitinophagaceae bacterium]|nr:GAF domain-containing protein [Chitinophagaceae bacterium]